MVGDCVSSISSISSGIVNNNSSLTQSPKMMDIVANPEKKLFKGPAYTSIYCSKWVKFEISSKTLRKTDISSGKEKLYHKVTKTEEENNIEFRSENWIKYYKDRTSTWWISEQRDVADRPLGCIKISKKGPKNNWVYYVRKGRNT